QLAVHTVGGVVAAGDTIMLIVPNADNLIVEAKINPQDIDQLQLGQKAMLRFSAFNQRTTPEIAGIVVRISADTSTDQRSGQNYYVIRVAMPPQEIARLGEVRLVPGMPVEAFIQTGERTVLSYLVKPLHDQFMRAFKEKRFSGSNRDCWETRSISNGTHRETSPLLNRRDVSPMFFGQHLRLEI